VPVNKDLNITSDFPVFVGSDKRMTKIECALIASIFMNTSCSMNIFFMRHSENFNWNIGRRYGNPYSGVGWATDFSCYRFAVPGLCDKFYKGLAIDRALYLDADMIVLGDLTELFNLHFDDGEVVKTVDGGGMDVILWNINERNGFLKSNPDWLSLDEMKLSGNNFDFYVNKMNSDGKKTDVIPREWNCKDYCDKDSKLIHFTDMTTQPWKPWPERFSYDKKHKSDSACKEFERYIQIAKDNSIDSKMITSPSWITTRD